MSIGLAKTQIANPANIGGGGGVSDLGDIIVLQMWQQLNDANASAFTSDTAWQSGVNLTNSISLFPGIVRAAGDTTYTQFAIANQGPANGWNYTGRGTQLNQTSGPMFGSCRTYASRVVPMPGLFAAGSQPNFFFGICRNIGDAAGLHTGLAGINSNGAQTDVGWRKNNLGIGYVGFNFQPAVSANWLLAVGDGAGNATLIDSSVVANKTLTTQLIWTYNGAGILKFYIGRLTASLVGTIKTSLPSDTMTMALFHGHCNVTLTATPTGVQQTVGFQSASLSYT